MLRVTSSDSPVISSSHCFPRDASPRVDPLMGASYFPEVPGAESIVPGQPPMTSFFHPTLPCPSDLACLALVPSRHEASKALLGRRRFRASGAEGSGGIGGSGVGIGGSTSHHPSERDGSVELTLLSETGDAMISPPVSSRHGMGGMMSGGMGSSGGTRREGGKNSQSLSARPTTFYL